MVCGNSNFKHCLHPEKCVHDNDTWKLVSIHLVNIIQNGFVLASIYHHHTVLWMLLHRKHSTLIMDY